MTLSLSEVETESQSDALDRVVGLSSSSFSESSPETKFIPEPRAETHRRQNMDKSGHILMAFFENIVD